MTRMPDQLLPSRADLDASTDRTAAIMADPAASLSDRLLAAKAEETTHQAYLQRPGTDAELQADAEMEGGRTRSYSPVYLTAPRPIQSLAEQAWKAAWEIQLCLTAGASPHRTSSSS